MSKVLYTEWNHFFVSFLETLFLVVVLTDYNYCDVNANIVLALSNVVHAFCNLESEVKEHVTIYDDALKQNQGWESFRSFASMQMQQPSKNPSAVGLR